jgi:hypothetical protein
LGGQFVTSAALPLAKTRYCDGNRKYCKMLDFNIQDAYRVLAAKRVKQIINLRTPCNHLYKTHLYNIKKLCNKLKINNVTVAPADKSRTVALVDNNTYENKTVVNDSLTNHFSKLTTEPTGKYQNQLRQTLQKCDKILRKYKEKYLIQNKPTPPLLTAQLKLHKADTDPSNNQYQCTSV